MKRNNCFTHLLSSCHISTEEKSHQPVLSSCQISTEDKSQRPGSITSCKVLASCKHKTSLFIFVLHQHARRKSLWWAAESRLSSLSRFCFIGCFLRFLLIFLTNPCLCVQLNIVLSYYRPRRVQTCNIYTIPLKRRGWMFDSIWSSKSDYGTQKKNLLGFSSFCFFPLKGSLLLVSICSGLAGFCFFPFRKKIVGRNLLGF